MRKVHGHGINDADYKVTKYLEGKQVWMCPYYHKWRSMIQRVFDTKFKDTFHSYERCTICEDWIYFSKFKAWMETQDWEGKQLDKDLLVFGNKHYSPETCVFVSVEINKVILGELRSKEGGLLGTTPSGTGKYKAFCHEGNGQRYLGEFPTQEAAHNAWLECKVKHLEQLLRGEDARLREALLSRYTHWDTKIKQLSSED